jgi:hypothetical protein
MAGVGTSTARFAALCGLAALAACQGRVITGGADGGTGGDGGAADSGAGDGGATPDAGDEYLPWEDPPTVYRQWTNGPPSDPNFFPVAVWLQSEGNADAYQAIGVNTFIGLWQGPTDPQLAGLKAAGMLTLCAQDGVWASHLGDGTIRGWTQDDEPDNAQPDGAGGYGPCVDPAVIQTRYAAFRGNDATRPVYLNLGQGVSWTDYYGRGSACAGKLAMYAEYEKGADIVSFDIYPVNSTDPPVQGNLWMVPQGVDRLRQWSGYKKPVWNWIETTPIDDPAHRPTPAQVRAEVWMSLVHGSAGIGYFAHVFQPQFIEAGLLADPAMKDGVKAIDAEIALLAPALNTASIGNAATVASSNGAVPVDFMVKRAAGTLYLFAVAMRPGATQATFTLRGLQSGTATVIGESRTIPIAGGNFQDAFAADYAVHLYRLGP